MLQNPVENFFYDYYFRYSSSNTSSENLYAYARTVVNEALGDDELEAFDPIEVKSFTWEGAFATDVSSAQSGVSIEQVSLYILVI